MAPRLNHITLLIAVCFALYAIMAALRAWAVSRLEREQPSDDLKDEVQNYKRKSLIGTALLIATLVIHGMWVGF